MQLRDHYYLVGSSLTQSTNFALVAQWKSNRLVSDRSTVRISSWGTKISPCSEMIERKLKQKYWNKRVNAKAEGIEFSLSLDQFVQLMNEANITIDDLHIKGYHLSRTNDTGAYEIGNCRFKHYLINYAEKKVSDKARKASSENMKRLNKKRLGLV